MHALDPDQRCPGVRPGRTRQESRSCRTVHAGVPAGRAEQAGRAAQHGRDRQASAGTSRGHRIHGDDARRRRRRARGARSPAGAMSGYVLDASVAVTALTEPGTPAADLLVEDDAVFLVPSIFDAEVLSALRGLVRGLKFDQAAAADLIVDLMVLPVDRWHMSSLLPRMWELRDNLTPYDAAYVALAELTGAVLVTGDERITAAPGTRCDIHII